MMTPAVSRAAAALKNHLNLRPGDQLDRLIAAAESSATIADLPQWVRTGLKKMNYPGA